MNGREVLRKQITQFLERAEPGPLALTEKQWKEIEKDKVLMSLIGKAEADEDKWVGKLEEVEKYLKGHPLPLDISHEHF